MRRTRDQFAPKLGVTADRVKSVEQVHIPDSDYLLRLSRVLPSHIALDLVVATFPVLRPTGLDVKRRQSLERARLHTDAGPQRGKLKNDLATELMPEAKRQHPRADPRTRPEESVVTTIEAAVAMLRGTSEAS